MIDLGIWDEVKHSDKLLNELAIWSDSGHRVLVFLRDDDAVEITPGLMRLQNLCECRNIPSLLAIIPKFARSELGDFVNNHELITPAIHGYSHVNHAGENEKKAELGNHRSVYEVLGELQTGQAAMVDLFGERLSKILVPPWNRIDAQVASKIESIGFTGISGFGWKILNKNVRWMNTHVDIIDWKQNKTAKALDDVLDDLVANLQTARQNVFAPIGILTHHLIHDELCWSVLEKLLDLLSSQQYIKWAKADDLIANSSHKSPVDHP